MASLARSTAIILLWAVSVAAQGVPVVDVEMAVQREAILEQGERDLALQRNRLARAQELGEIEREQLAMLQNILDASTGMGGGGVTGIVGDLESGSTTTDAAALHDPEDPNPAAPQMFGDAAVTVEQLIIRVAQETHGHPGVGKAGLSVVQWRCLMQALIWQESRFTIGARSPVGAFGLTQIMPGTASDLGIHPAYYDSPYLQVQGGARYLAQMLDMFDGNIVHALAAYNSGPGNVQDYGGVPPFAETQHYVQVIPAQYNRYLATVGGIDALGTIEPALLANSTMSLSSHGAGVYGDYSLISVQAAARRIASIIDRIDETGDIHESLALNTYARAELARLIAIRTRLKATRTRALGAAEIAIAASQLQEQQFMDLTLEGLR